MAKFGIRLQIIASFILFFLSFQTLQAQYTVPKGITYQAIANDNLGKPVANRNIVVEISLRAGAPNGIIIWQEAHSVVTNEYGMFSLIIGKGISTTIGSSPSFEEINWAQQIHYVQVKTDFGNGLLDMGTVQLQSVPFALLADSALHYPVPKLKNLFDVNDRGLRIYQTIRWNGKQWVAGDSLLADYFQLTGDMTVTRNIYIKSDLFVNDSIVSKTIKASQGDIDNLSINTDLLVQRDATINRDATIKNNLRVNKNVTIDNNLTLKNNFLGNNITANFAYLDTVIVYKYLNTEYLAINKNANVGGNLRVTDDITGLNDLYITDSITAKTIDANKGDFDILEIDTNALIKNNLQVNNNLLVKKNLTSEDDVFALNDIYVTDTLKAATIDAGNGRIVNVLITQDANIQRDLSVGRDAFVARDLTVNRNIIAKGNLALSDTLATKVIKSTRGIFDSITVNMTQTVQNSTIKNNQLVQNDLIVNKKILAGEDITALNDIYVNDSITATTIKTTMAEFVNVNVSNSQTVQNKLNVNNDAYVNDSITAATIKTIKGDFTNVNVSNSQLIQNKLNVNNDAYIGDSITAATIKTSKGDFSNVNVSNSQVIQNKLNVNNDAYVTDSLTANALKSNYGDIENVIVRQNETVQGKLTVNNDIYSGDSIIATSIKAINGHVTNDLNIGGDVLINNDLKINGTLTLQDGIISVNKITNDGGLTANLATSIPTEQAVKTYISTVQSGIFTVTGNIETNLTAHRNANDHPVIDGVTKGNVSGNKAVIVNSNKEITGFNKIQTDELVLNTGATINEFSIDGTLAGNSDAAVPTEKAVKKYVDDNLTNVSGQFLKKDGTVQLSQNWNAGGKTITAGDFISTTNGAPFTVSSNSDWVQFLNVDMLDGKHSNQFLNVDPSSDNLLANWNAGNYKITAKSFSSTETSASPFTVASTTKVTNLHADLLDSKEADSFVFRSGTRTLLADWNAGAWKITAKTFASTETTSAPFTVASKTKVTDLHADLLDGKEADSFVFRSGTRTLLADWNAGAWKITAKTFASTETTSAPFTVASSAVVTNLNADQLDSKHAADFLLKDGTTALTGNLNLAFNNINNLKVPSTQNQASPKRYVDSMVNTIKFWSKAGSRIYNTTSGDSIGIGTSTPKTGLEINDRAFLISGSTAVLPTTSLGDGTRFLWVPAKAALRAGMLTLAGGADAFWDYSNIGAASVAFGFNTKASGQYSVAMGNTSSSTAIGAFSFGFGTSSSGQYSVAFGNSTTASGNAAFAMGSEALAVGNYSFVTGISTTSDGIAEGAFVGGKYNDVSSLDDSAIFVIGDGVNSSSRRNLMYARTNGDLTVRRDILAGRYVYANSVKLTSDANLKEDIEPLNEVLPSVLQITPVSFYFKDRQNYAADKQIGFLAQEVEKFFPELVSTNEKGIKSLAYANMTAILLKAIKEQQEMINSQNLRLQSQEKKLLDLEKRIELIEKK